MTGNRSSSSSSKADLDLSLKRLSVKLWIIKGCDDDKPLLLKQDGCFGCFNLEFDRVIGDIPFTDDELVRVYMAGLKDEIAASLRPFRPTSLLEAKYLALEEATKVVAETQSPRPQESDKSSLSTQEVQEKASQDQEESLDKQEDRRAIRIRGGRDGKETILLKQLHGSIAEFNLNFDLVTSDLTLTEEELVCVYIAGLDHEIAAPGRLLWPRTLREAKHQARCHELLFEIQETRSHHDDEEAMIRAASLRWIKKHKFKELQILKDSYIRKESTRMKDLMNIKLSYSNEAIKQILEELKNIKDNLISENSTRKKNLLKLCDDCMKLSRSTDINEERTTSDESHNQGSGRLQPSSDESHSQGSDRSQSSTVVISQS